MTSSNSHSDQAPDLGSILMSYLPKLIRLAESNMSPKLMQRVGADDMADSILGSIIRIQNQGKIQISIEQSQDFWRLLVAISLNKIRKKARDETAGKRDFGKEISITHEMPSLEEMVADRRDPHEQDGKNLAKVLDAVQPRLSEDERLILQGRLEGLTFNQIAMNLKGGRGMSSKTAQRKWETVQDMLKQAAKEMDFC
jgi:RNA polymerase sigma-70 factor (ECF subfamily)